MVTIGCPLATLALFALLASAASPPGDSAPWRRHVIDASSRGADGVRLADANGDGLPDIATGWEEGGVTRLYLNPGPKKVRDSWPAVTVDNTPSVEDAVLVDLDRDGAQDVVSSCEGRTRAMFVHWGPPRARSLDPGGMEDRNAAGVARTNDVDVCTPLPRRRSQRN